MNCVGWGRVQITFPSSPYGVKLRLPYNTGTANSASLRLRSVKIPVPEIFTYFCTRCTAKPPISSAR